MTTKIYAIKSFKNLSIYTLGSHTDSIVGCFFEENSLNVSFKFLESFFTFYALSIVLLFLSSNKFVLYSYG